jgi:hypothetical protein
MPPTPAPHAPRQEMPPGTKCRPPRHHMPPPPGTTCRPPRHHMPPNWKELEQEQEKNPILMRRPWRRRRGMIGWMISRFPNQHQKQRQPHHRHRSRHQPQSQNPPSPSTKRSQRRLRKNSPARHPRSLRQHGRTGSNTGSNGLAPSSQPTASAGRHWPPAPLPTKSSNTPHGLGIGSCATASPAQSAESGAA